MLNILESGYPILFVRLSVGVMLCGHSLALFSHARPRFHTFALVFTQRIALFEMVKDGSLTIEEAHAEVSTVTFPNEFEYFLVT